MAYLNKAVPFLKSLTLTGSGVKVNENSVCKTNYQIRKTFENIKEMVQTLHLNLHGH